MQKKTKKDKNESSTEVGTTKTISCLPLCHSHLIYKIRRIQDTITS